MRDLAPNIIFLFIIGSKSTRFDLSDKKIPVKKFEKLSEIFNQTSLLFTFLFLFLYFKVRLKWGKSKIQKYFSEKKSVFFADLPHNRPFPGLWCKKKFQIDFSQKNDFDLNPVFNPVQPHLYKRLSL